MMNPLDTRDIIQILDFIVDEKAGLFILEPKLDLLFSWVSGYQRASEASLTEYKNLNRLDDFSKFVHRKNKDEFENTFGWFGSIRAKYGGDFDGFESFCRLYREFRNTH